MRIARSDLPVLGILMLVSALTGSGTYASAPGSEFDATCDRAATQIAQETGVPGHVLMAITRTETARFGTPWPWTVNMEGDGHWFETRAAALQFAQQRHASGATSFDVGCFQINYRWHGEHFPSIAAMFEPYDNARYAARFLSELYREMGTWDAAVGAYHSRTERYAARYLRIYHGHLERLGGRPDMPAPPAAEPSNEPRENRFPLLQAGGESSLGSLVPSGASTASSLFGARP